MHRKTQSVDSTYNIRRNPLNIRNLDGSDLILDKFDITNQLKETTGTVKRGTGTVKKRTVTPSEPDKNHQAALKRPESAIVVSSKSYSEGLSAPLKRLPKSPTDSMLDQVPNDLFEFEQEELMPMHARHMISTGVTPPNLDPDSGRSSPSSDHQARDYQLDICLGSPEDLTSAVMKSYSGLKPGTNLGRKNTITLANGGSRRGKKTTNADSSSNSVRGGGSNESTKGDSDKQADFAHRSNASDHDHNSQGSATSRSSSIHLTDGHTSDGQESLYSEPRTPVIEDTTVEGKQEQERGDLQKPASEIQVHQQPQQRSPLEPGDRGRLFLKISGLKDVKLPLDHEERPRFSLMLDNGIQCVTTYPINFQEDHTEINQEFELVVGQDLQLVITLVASKRKPRVAEQQKQQQQQQPSSAPSSPRKKLGRMFTSKRKKEEVNIKNNNASITQPEDSWQRLVGPKGEFGRAVIIASQIENDIYGKAQRYNLSCFNEWTEELYRICGLQVTMMYVPKLYREEQLPGSLQEGMSVLKAVRQTHEAAKMTGYLSQQGGDCSYFRRRWFSMQDKLMVGHHEETRQVRNTIDLSGAKKLTDRTSDPSIYEERMFKVWFESEYDDEDYVITFMADTVESKIKWYEALASGIQPVAQSWIDLVLQRDLEHKQQLQQVKKRWESSAHRANGSRSSFIERL